MNPIEKTSSRRRMKRRIAATAAATAVVCGGLIGLSSAAEAVAPTAGSLVLNVGSDQSQRSVSWYQATNAAAVVQVTSVQNDWSNAATFNGTVAANSAGGTYNGRATITGLQPSTQYWYRVGGVSDSTWSTVYSFQTRAFTGDFEFLFYGDPQIGASGNATNDGNGWANTVATGLAAYPKTELLVSGGDQVETNNTETMWTSFLQPDGIRQVPYAATIGNHDTGGYAYQQHFAVPNKNSTGLGTTAGTSQDYWYMYKGVLFIDIDSNGYTGATGDTGHLTYIQSVLNAHPEAKYKVLVFHHSIYSTATHAADSDVVTRRNDMATQLSTMGVDLVLQGHDHVYARSYEMKNGTKANSAETAGQDNVTPGPGGVIYVTANSASGSKYYSIGAAGTAYQAYTSVTSQEQKRSYVRVQVQNDKLVVQDLRAEANGSLPVGGVIDQVTINKPSKATPKPTLTAAQPTVSFPAGELNATTALAAIKQAAGIAVSTDGTLVAPDLSGIDFDKAGTAQVTFTAKATSYETVVSDPVTVTVEITPAAPSGPTLVDVTGTVNDESAAVDGACVYLYAPAAESASYASCAQSDGAFSLGNVPAGDYTVAVADPSGRHTTWWSPAPVTIDGSTPLSLSMTTSKGAITGTVSVGANGLSGACAFGYQAGDRTAAKVATCGDTEGAYWMSANAGDYDVAFYDPTGDHATQWNNGIAVTAGAATSVNGSMQIVSGAVSGVITDAVSGQPVANACVYLYAPSAPSASYATCTGADGSYWIGGVTQGDYQLAVADFTAHETKWQDVTVGKSTTADVQLTAVS